MPALSVRSQLLLANVETSGLDGASGVGLGRFANGWFGDPALDHISRDPVVYGQYSSCHCPFLSGAGASVWVMIDKDDGYANH